MAFDPASVLSRTAAGDAELSTPSHGLALGQRRLLTFLGQPRALEELAAEHGLERAKLDRDLGRLASLHLIAIDGYGAPVAASAVVLGGWRPPSMLRWLLPPLLLLGGALVYFGFDAPAPFRRESSPARIGTPQPGAKASNPLPVAHASIPLPVAKPSILPPEANPSIPLPAAKVPAPVPAAAPVAQAIVPVADATRPPPPIVPAAPRPAATPARASASTLPARPTPPAMVRAEPVPGAAAQARHAEVVAREALVQSLQAVPPAIARAEPMPRQPPAAPPVEMAAMPVAVTVPMPAPVAHLPPVTAVPAARSTGTEAPARASAAGKLALAAPARAAAQAPTTRLLPLTHDNPAFPREALVRGIASGTVRARLTIDAIGKVTAVDIVDSRPGRVFDRAVTQALSRWTFTAGAAGRRTEVEIAFRRDD